MYMKQKNLIAIATCFALLLAGCSKEEPGGGTTPHTGDGVQFEVAMEVVHTARLTTDADLNSTWTDGDKIGIYAVKSGQSLTASGNYVDNACLTLTAGSWTLDQTIYYPLGSDLDFYAYYPYNAALSDATAIPLSTLADQSTSGNFDLSDFMLAVATAQASKKVSLTFSHAMALVEVRTDRVDPVFAFREGAFRVTLNGVGTSGTLNLGTQAVTAGTANSSVTMYRVPTADGSWVFRAMVPAQTKAAGTLFHFAQYSATKADLPEINFLYGNAAPVTLTAGDAAVWDITLDYGLDPAHTYVVGDVYPYKGTPIGVVYAVSGGGLQGKIVSLDETELRWSAIYSDTGASSTTDGLANMATIKALNNTFSGYSAFAWVDQKNGVAGATTYAAGDKGKWYLPAREELGNYTGGLYQAYNAYGNTDFNTRLTLAGGTAFTALYYWSSTEIISSYAWVVHVYDGDAYSNSKTHSGGVRCVRAF